MRLALWLAVATSLLSGTAVADELQADLQARRVRLASSLDAGTMFVAWSAPRQVYSADVDHPYRQDSNMLYLTGISQEETILVLMPGNEKSREILFITQPNATREHWTGHMLTKDEATAASGIATVFFTSQFDAFVTAMFNRETFGQPRYRESTDFDAFFDAVSRGTVKLSLVFGARPGPHEPLTPPFEFARLARDRFVGVTITDATSAVASLRQVKTAYEQRVLERSLDISSDAQIAGMREAAPGKYRISGPGRDRARVSRARRHMVVSVNRRERAECDDAALSGVEPPDESGRAPACRRRR